MQNPNRCLKSSANMLQTTPSQQHAPLPPCLAPSGVASLHSRRPCRSPLALSKLRGPRMLLLLLLLLLLLWVLRLLRWRWRGRRSSVAGHCISAAACRPRLQLGSRLGPWQARCRSALCPRPARPLRPNTCRWGPPAALAAGAAAAAAAVAAPGEEPAQEAVAPGALRHAAGLLRRVAAAGGCSCIATEPASLKLFVKRGNGRRRPTRRRRPVWGRRRAAGIHSIGVPGCPLLLLLSPVCSLSGWAERRPGEGGARGWLLDAANQPPGREQQAARDSSASGGQLGVTLPCRQQCVRGADQAPWGLLSADAGPQATFRCRSECLGSSFALPAPPLPAGVRSPAAADQTPIQSSNSAMCVARSIKWREQQDRRATSSSRSRGWVRLD